MSITYIWSCKIDNDIIYKYLVYEKEVIGSGLPYLL